jgi:hypothetical protein
MKRDPRSSLTHRAGLFGNRRAVSGILAAVILFAMLFIAGVSYILYINQASQQIVQANAARQGAELQAGKESLAIGVSLVGGTNLVVSVNNTGGTPAVIEDAYVRAQSGSGSPWFTGPTGGGTNATGVWPISLEPGQSTSSLYCKSHTHPSCNIELTGYSYSGTPVMVEVVTKAGNTYGTPYPPAAAPVGQANPLVVSLVATPPQVFSCVAPNCITVTATVYNYATSQVTNVQLNPAVPPPEVTGTQGVGVSGGSCGAPSPGSSIAGYSGSGTPSYITFTCTYSATTGPVGGFASFSVGALGTLNGGAAASAQAISNTIQIGGSSNVPTQGAFAADYFFVKYSSCQNAPSGSVGSYSYSSPCVTAPAMMPPSSLSSLTPGNYISGFSDYYVAYYVQVTNNFNTTLPILQYSYLYGDPGISEEAYSFLVGTASTPYYPNYCSQGGCLSNNLPELTAYTATATTCTNTPSACIEVAPGQTVVLTFAACGWGSSNWVWGGTSYAESLDNSAGCITTPPGYINAGNGQVEVPEGTTLSIVLTYLYKNTVYSQSMPFEGQTITNLRTSSTGISCSPSTDPVNAPSTCTVTVTDLSSGTPVTPTGTVSVYPSPVNSGTFSGGGNQGSCTLSGSGAVATCTLTYTPLLGLEQVDTLTASYPGDTYHSGSSSTTTVTAIQRSTQTTVVCNPTSTTINTPTSCTVTVTDTSPGTAVTPTGTVNLSDSPTSSGTFSTGSSCTLSASGTCSFTYTPNSGLIATVTLTGSYQGDTNHLTSSGTASIKWARSTTTTVSCLPNPDAAGTATTCTATVTDTSSGSPVTPTGTVTFTQSSPATGTFNPSNAQCALSQSVVGTATCTVTLAPGAGQVGTVTVSASYPGDPAHLSSSGSTMLTVTKAVTKVTVTCSGQACTATVSGYVGSINGETMTFSQSGGSGTITFPTGTTCILSGSSCFVLVSGTATGSPVVQASYPGDTNNLANTGQLTITIGADTFTVSCSPVSFGAGSNSVCTAALSSFTGTVTGETISFSQSGGAGSVTFVSNSCTLSAAGTCPVTITGKNTGSATVQASYPGDTANVAKLGSQSVTVTKHPVVLGQVATICSDQNTPFRTSSCSGSLTVNSGDVVVVAVSIMRQSSTCVTVSSISGSTDSSYSPVYTNAGTAAQNGHCAYSMIFYASASSSGTDTISVSFSSQLNAQNGDAFVIVAYDVGSALTPPTGVYGTCTSSSSSCTHTAIKTSHPTSTLSYPANSFLVTAAAVCPNANDITANPSGITSDYGLSSDLVYAGHGLPASSGTTSFSMKSDQSSSCWAIEGAEFPDPPAGPPAASGSGGVGQVNASPLLTLPIVFGTFNLAWGERGLAGPVGGLQESRAMKTRGLLIKP